MTDETNGAAPAAAEAEASLESTLSSTYDRIMARESEPAERPATEAQAEPEKPAADRPRGPDGKFVAKEAVETPTPDKTETPPAAEAKPAAPAEAGKPPAPETQQPEKVLIPKTWQNDARRGVFIKAPPEVQKALAEREAEMENGVAKLQQRYQAYEQLVGPIRQQLAVEGSSPERYFGALMAADSMLRQNGAEGIRQIARMYGVDLASLGAPPGQAQEPSHPLQAEVMTLRQQLDEMRAQPVKMAEAEAGQQIDAFAADPANVYFPQVRALMSSILSNGAATTLKDAYEIATQAHPEVRKQIEAEKSAQAQAAQAEATKRAAIEAQRAAAVNAATRGGVGATSAARGTWQQTMERAADRLFSS